MQKRIFNIDLKTTEQIIFGKTGRSSVPVLFFVSLIDSANMHSIKKAIEQLKICKYSQLLYLNYEK